MHSEDAHAYIAAIALDPSATLHATGLLLGTRSPSSKRDPGAASTVSSSGQPLKSTRRRWTATDRQQLTELARTGQISVAVEKFGIPEQYAKQLVARFAKEDAVRPLAPAGAGRAPVVDARPVASLDSDPHRPGPASASLATPTTNTKVSPDSQEPPTRACAPEAPAAAAPPPRARHPAAKVIVRIREVEQRTGLKRSSIYARLNPKSKYYDPTFPRRVLLTGKPALEEGNNKGAVGFIEEDIDRWISSREMP
ncbi:MAG: AlpA family phage regulatory protein [Proteobacteria bacterium]|nr:AlpA family phage regulatory protein [Pseudomonadota bacterium]